MILDFARMTNMALILGFDEVGRGCLAGPVVIAGVIDTNQQIPKGIVIRDSKLMNRKQREMSAAWIMQQYSFGIGQAESWEIDKLGIVKAVQLAAQRAREKIIPKFPVEIVHDGREPWFADSKSIIHGDQLIRAISMASIIAKVYRDSLMKNLVKQYPDWGFECHVGYGTKKHQEMIKKYGLIKDLHRRSFCKQYV